MLNRHSTAGDEKTATRSDGDKRGEGWLSGLSNVFSSASSRRYQTRLARNPQPPAVAQADAMLLGPNVRDYRIMCIGSLTSPFWDHFDWLGGVVVSVTSAIDPGVGLARASKFPSNRLLLLCDLDAFAALEDAMEALIRFRQDNPEVAVVIGSKEFGGHDFSVERALIADASLKLPAGKTALGLVLGAAISNHRAISSRPRSEQSLDVCG